MKAELAEGSYISSAFSEVLSAQLNLTVLKILKEIIRAELS
jgi:hypothetical protein